MQSIEIKNPFGAPVFFEESVSSTMDAAEVLAERGEAHGTVITADYQESGRGRNKRVWLSRKGENLLFTVILRFPRFTDIPTALTLRAGLAVSLALEEAFPDLQGLVRVKWPNDVMLCRGASAGKTAGILTETSVQGDTGAACVFLGVGINLCQNNFPDEIKNKAVSVSSFLRNQSRKINITDYFAPDTPAVLLQCVLKCLYDELKTTNESWKSRLEERLYKKDEEITFIDGAAESGKIICGLMEGINDKGEILIIPRGENRSFAFNTGELRVNQKPAIKKTFCDDSHENHSFLTEQIITYIGNKRALLDFITKGIQIVQKRLGKKKLDIFDVFTGSGIVARFYKQFSNLLLVNDLEQYAAVTGECYLSNKNELNMPLLEDMYNELIANIDNNPLKKGIITELYSPKDDNNIKKNERVFYTKKNAMYIDTMRRLIQSVPLQYQKYFLAPLIAKASVHANTSGIFKGFHKNKKTGVGQFGGSNSDALFRIKGNIVLPFPVFSNFSCNYTVYNGDSNQIVKEAPEVDLAYLDPPYNQHPYGSNYFMLNLILKNEYPQNISNVSGIPNNWNRSAYNKKQHAYSSLSELVQNIKAKYVLISFNSEGFISFEEMTNMLKKIGKVQILETPYNSFRGCRNLSDLAKKGTRNVHVTEYLYLLEK